MTGYRDRVIKIPFDLSDDPVNDPIWVIIRNPRLLPPAEIASFAGDGSDIEQEKDAEGNPVLGEDGKPKVRVADPAKGMQRLYAMVARLVVAARVYDATQAGEFNPETGEPVGEPPRMPHPPWTPETAAKLPLEILQRVSEEFAEAVNPQKRASPGTPKTFSSPPSPSTTEPGEEASLSPPSSPTSS